MDARSPRLVERRGDREVCPYCRDGFERGAAVLVCEGCGATYHDACCQELTRCAIAGCGGRRARPTRYGETPEGAVGAIPFAGTPTAAPTPPLVVKPSPAPPLVLEPSPTPRRSADARWIESRSRLAAWGALAALAGAGLVWLLRETDRSFGGTLSNTVVGAWAFVAILLGLTGVVVFFQAFSDHGRPR